MRGERFDDRQQLSLGQTEEVCSVLYCYGAVVCQIAPHESAQGGGFCHRCKRRTGAEGLFLLRSVAECAAFAQRTEQTTPGIKRALLFIVGHAMPAAEKAQFLAAAAAFLGGVQNDRGQLALARGGEAAVV